MLLNRFAIAAFGAALCAPIAVDAAQPPGSVESWQTRSLVSTASVAPASQIAIDNANQTLVAWVDEAGAARTPAEPLRVNLLRGDGLAWQGMTVANASTAAIADVDLAVAGQPYVAYHDAGNPGDSSDDRIRVVLVFGSNLVTQTLADVPAAPGFDLAASRTGMQLWLAFRDPQSGALRVQTRDGGDLWTIENVPTIGTAVDGIALTDDGNGRRQLAYTSIVAGTRALHHAQYDEGAWTTTTLRAAGVAAGPVHIAAGAFPDARPAILFAVDDAANQRVELLRRDADGSWATVLMEGYGAGTNPATVYALGFDALLFRWRALFRRADAAAVPMPIRYAQVSVLDPVASVRDFGLTPHADPVPAFDYGPVSAELGRNPPRAVYRRNLNADLDFSEFSEDWLTRRVIGGETGINPQAGTALTRDLIGKPVVAAAFQSSVVYQDWRDGRFNRSTIAFEVGATTDIDIAIGPDGTQHAVFHRLGPADLVYAFREISDGQWTRTTLDADGDRGRDAQVHVGRDGTVYITYTDLTNQRPIVRIGRQREAFASLADVNGSATGPFPGSLRSALYEGTGADGTPYARLVAIYTPAGPGANLLRTFEIERRDGALIHARGRTLSVAPVIEDGQTFNLLEPELDIAMLSDGRALLALIQRSASNQRRLHMAVFDAMQSFATPPPPLVDEQPPFEPQEIHGVARELRLGVKNQAVASARVVARIERTSPGLHELVHYVRGLQIPASNFGAVNPLAGRIAFDARAEDMVVWYDTALGGQALDLAALVSPRLGLRADPFLPWDAGTFDDRKNDEQVCECVECVGSIVCLLFAVRPCPPVPDERALAGSGAEPDLGARLRTLFDSTPAGRYYLDLWAIHGADIIDITHRDPALYWQRITTYASFAPALTALVEGRGDEYRMTPELLAQARAVWQGWAAAGSPALAAAVESELARSNQLADYEGMTLQAWFAALTPGSAGDALMADGFE